MCHDGSSYFRTDNPSEAEAQYHLQIAKRGVIVIADGPLAEPTGLKAYKTKITQFTNNSRHHQFTNDKDLDIYNRSVKIEPDPISAQLMADAIKDWSDGDALTFVPQDGNSVFDDYTVVRINSTTFELHCGQFSVSDPVTHNKAKAKAKTEQTLGTDNEAKTEQNLDTNNKAKTDQTLGTDNKAKTEQTLGTNNKAQVKQNLDYDAELKKVVGQIQALLSEPLQINAGCTTYYYPRPNTRALTVKYDHRFKTVVVVFPTHWSTLFRSCSFTARLGVDIIMSYENDMAGVKLIKKLNTTKREAYSDAQQQQQIRLSNGAWHQIDTLLKNPGKWVFNFDNDDCNDADGIFYFKRSTLLNNITSQKNHAYNQYTALYKHAPPSH